MKKSIMLIMLLVILVGCKAKVEKYSEGLVFEYIEVSDSYKVTGYDGDDTKLIIPSLYNDKAVTELAFKTVTNNLIITEIILPNSIETFALNSLNMFQFRELKNITIPANCKYFASALNYSSNIDIIIPIYHKYLKEVTISGTEIVMTKDEDEVVYIPKAKNQNSSLTLPSTIKKISDNAAAYTNYYNIILPDGLLYIGCRAFINTFQFRDDKLPTIINIPNSVESIGDYAFQGSISDRKLDLPKNLVHAGICAFAYNNINQIIIHDKLETFENLFQGGLPMDTINHIDTIEFAGLNMNESAKSNFIENFVKTNFSNNYYDGKEIAVIIDNQFYEEEIINLLELSLNAYKLEYPYKDHLLFKYSNN